MSFSSVSSSDIRVLTVSQLNRQVGQLLSSHFDRIWVRGEISGFTKAASGHWYFSIKDSSAMVRAVMFRSRAAATGLSPQTGEQFEFLCSVTLYEARGDYQLQVEALRRVGRGDLHEAFLRLKEKLAAEGLFDAERKRPVAAMPAAIGVITSLAAAALRDVLITLRRRAPHVPVIVYPAAVQGRDSAPSLVQALQAALDHNKVDTVLLVRGGGSIEDLWSFNDETLARKVASSPIPIISGVGHETDFTICDFVADVRAATPTAAAELVCNARDTCMAAIQAALRQLDTAHGRLIERASIRLDRAVSGLVSPQQRLQQQQDRLRSVIHRLERVMPALHERRTLMLDTAVALLGRCAPALQPRRERLAMAVGRMTSSAQRYPGTSMRRLAAARQALQALDPHQVLARGYAIVRDGNQEVIKNALDLSVGETLSVEFGQGAAQVNVRRVHGLL